MNEEAKMPASRFLEVWKQAFAKIITPLGAANLKVTDGDAAAPELLGGDAAPVMKMSFTGGGSLKGGLVCTCSKTVAVQCAQLLMSETVDSAVEFTETHADGFQELIRQVAGEVAVAWKLQRGLPADLNYQAQSPDLFSSHHNAAILLESDGWKGWLFRVDLDNELFESLAAVAPAEEPEQAAPQEMRSEVDGPALPSNLELILDVQLEATIRFGEREMLLRDVFSLLPGTVVELNQLVTEPAELLVAGRLVAKGEVVVVDGNFGLRVSEVVRAAQRAAVLSI